MMLAKNLTALELSRRGGLARMGRLTKAERSELGRKAATARWARVAEREGKR